tara:strand:+ start:319 stop:2439 length:2121 start_codon:yes stop_codon:yes gene_type:complete
MEKVLEAIKNNTFFSKNNVLILDFVLVLWVAYVLFPVLSVGFISDDAYNSQVLGKNIMEGVGLWERISSEIQGWLHGAGRFSPFSWIYTYSLYSLLPSPFIVKLITLILIVFNVLFYSKIILFITNNKNFSYICAFIVPLFFQLRLWHDPIMAFSFLIPLVGFFLFSTLILLINYLKENKPGTISLFCFIYSLSLCTYELTYVFISFYILIIIFSSTRNGWWKIILLVLFLTGIHLFITIYFRDSNLDSYPGSNLNFDYKAVFSSLLVQITSAFPLSWKLANAPAHESFTKISYSPLVVFSIFSLFFAFQFNRIKNSLFKSGVSVRLFIFSLALLFVPAVPIVLTGHQHELIDMGFGYGYIVVFLQYFGSAILFLYLIYYLKNRYLFRNERAFVLIFLIILSIGYFTRVENSFVVHEVNKAYKYPRDLLRKSIDSGILNGIPSEALLLRNERYPSDHRWFYVMNTGRKMNVCGINLIFEFPKCFEEKIDKEHIYGLAYFMSKDYKNGSVFVAKLQNVSVIEGVPVNMKFQNYKVYSSKTNKLEEVSTSKTYDLLKIANTEVGNNSNDYDLRDFEVDQVSYAFKSFYSREGGKRGYLRWSSGKSIMIIDNSNSESLKKILSLTLIRPNSKHQHASISITHTIPGSRGFLEMSRYFVLGQKEIEIILNLKPGINYLNFKSNSHHIDNGDPRNIVFGIGNYILYDYPDN